MEEMVETNDGKKNKVTNENIVVVLVDPYVNG